MSIFGVIRVRYDALVFCAAAFVGCASPTLIGERLDGNVSMDSTSHHLRTDQCGNGIDDDQNGRIDDLCPCGPGETQSCFTGALANRRVGMCSDGVQVCRATTGVEWGNWGDSPCEGDALPSTEQCDGMDHDCDGARDEGCPCVLGEMRACGSQFLSAPCMEGTQSCRATGVWTECEGAIGPSADICDDIDNDCDGRTDTGCGCTPVPETCHDGIDNDCDGSIDEPACDPDFLMDGGLPSSDGGILPCLGAGDWIVRLPAVPLEGSIDSSPGGSAVGERLAIDAEGVLLLGQVSTARVRLGTFTAVAGVDGPGARVNTNLFVAGFTSSGDVRFGYAPTTRRFLESDSRDPAVMGSDIVSDGEGGAWISGSHDGITEVAPGIVYMTPVSGSTVEGDALLLHVNRHGDLIESRAFGRDGVAERFGALARQGDKLIIAGPPGVPLEMERFVHAPPTATAQYFMTFDPRHEGYRPIRVDYFDRAEDGRLRSALIAANARGVLYGVDGAGPLFLGQSTAGPTSGELVGSGGQDVTAVMRPMMTGYETIHVSASETASVMLSSLAMDDGGGIVIAGRFRGTTSFGGASLTAGVHDSRSPFGAFIAFFEADGTHRWSRALIASPTGSVGNSYAAIDPSGNVYFATYVAPGDATSTMDLGEGPVPLPADALVFASYSPSGALRWSLVEPMGDVRDVRAVAADGCGAMYVTARYRIGSWTSGTYLRRLTTR